MKGKLRPALSYWSESLRYSSAAGSHWRRSPGRRRHPRLPEEQGPGVPRGSGRGQDLRQGRVAQLERGRGSRVAGAPRASGRPRRSGHVRHLRSRSSTPSSRPTGTETAPVRPTARAARWRWRAARAAGRSRAGAHRTEERRIGLGRRRHRAGQRPLHRVCDLCDERGLVMLAARMKLLAVVAAVGLVVGATAIVAWGAIPDGNMIHGCYKNDSGELRVIDTGAGDACKKNETAPRLEAERSAGHPGAAGGQRSTGSRQAHPARTASRVTRSRPPPARPPTTPSGKWAQSRSTIPARQGRRAPAPASTFPPRRGRVLGKGLHLLASATQGPRSPATRSRRQADLGEARSPCATG